MFEDVVLNEVLELIDHDYPITNNVVDFGTFSIPVLQIKRKDKKTKSETVIALSCPTVGSLLNDLGRALQRQEQKVSVSVLNVLALSHLHSEPLESIELLATKYRSSPIIQEIIKPPLPNVRQTYTDSVLGWLAQMN